MSRPRKYKRVCCLPKNTSYGPLDGTCNEDDFICMSVEEFEVIKKIDFEKKNQEDCAKIMEVGRSTIQRIYDDARHKLAESLVLGKPLRIQGGDYKLCHEYSKEHPCINKNCVSHY